MEIICTVHGLKVGIVGTLNYDFLDDDLIQFKDFVWGRPTSLIPNSTAQKIYTKLTHMQTKELTAADQYNMVVNHSI